MNYRGQQVMMMINYIQNNSKLFINIYKLFLEKKNNIKTKNIKSLIKLLFIKNERNFSR